MFAFPLLNRLLVLLLLLSLSACKKLIDPNINPPGETEEPAVTPVGQPIGDPVSKTIGDAGGKLSSLDGKMELSIPQGALPGETEIYIQTVTNECPGGIGLSYHLMPDGIQFATPATVTWHYTDEDLNGTHPYFFFIAFQDAENKWVADLKKRDIDTVAKTISLSIQHFSIWSLMDDVRMFAEPSTLFENDVANLRIEKIISPAHDLGDGLASLPISRQIPVESIGSWLVDGDVTSPWGVLSSQGETATFAAPAEITSEHTVQISSELNYNLFIYDNDVLIAQFNRFIVFADITVTPGRAKFTLKIVLTADQGGAIYHDSTLLDVDIEGDQVTAANFINYVPFVDPDPQDIGGGCTVDWNPGQKGLLNITSTTGIVGMDANKHRAIILRLFNTDCNTIGQTTTCPGVPQSVVASEPLPASELAANFLVKDSAQQTVFGDIESTQYSFEWKPRQ
jgi:hypothetical protein